MTKTIYVYNDDAYNYALEIGAEKIVNIQRIEEGRLPSYSVITSLKDINTPFFPRTAVLTRPESKLGQGMAESLNRVLNNPSRNYSNPIEQIVQVKNDSIVPTIGFYKILGTERKVFKNASNGEEKMTNCAIMQYKSKTEYEFTSNPQHYRINALISNDTECPCRGDWKEKLALINSSVNRIIYIEFVKLQNGHYYSKWDFAD